MMKPIPFVDFRLTRRILGEPGVPLHFGIAASEQDNLIDPKVWEALTAFPDSTAIQTSSVRGAELRELYDLRLPTLVACNDSKQPFLELTLLAADEDFKASIFNLLHGYYRQSFYCLRSALELTLIGVFLELDKSTDVRDKSSGKSLKERWIHGEKAIKFKTACDGLRKHPVAIDLEEHLKECQFKGFFVQTHERTDDGWLWQLCNMPILGVVSQMEICGVGSDLYLMSLRLTDF